MPIRVIELEIRNSQYQYQSSIICKSSSRRLKTRSLKCCNVLLVCDSGCATKVLEDDTFHLRFADCVVLAALRERANSPLSGVLGYPAILGSSLRVCCSRCLSWSCPPLLRVRATLLHSAQPFFTWRYDCRCCLLCLSVINE